MHNSFYWRRNLGTGIGGGATAPVACFDAYGTIEPQIFTGTISDNTLVMTLAPAEFQGAITVQPAVGDIETPSFEGEASC